MQFLNFQLSEVTFSHTEGRRPKCKYRVNKNPRSLNLHLLSHNINSTKCQLRLVAAQNQGIPVPPLTATEWIEDWQPPFTAAVGPLFAQGEGGVKMRSVF